MCPPSLLVLTSVRTLVLTNLAAELSFHYHNFSASKLEENLGPAGHLMCPISFPLAASVGPMWTGHCDPSLSLLAVQHSQKPSASGVGWLVANYPFPHPNSASA